MVLRYNLDIIRNEHYFTFVLISTKPKTELENISSILEL